MANFTWTGAGGDSNFNNAQNWNPQQVPGYGSLAVPAGVTINLPTAVSGLDSLQITGTGTVTLTGVSLSFNNGVMVGTGETLLLSGGITLSAESLTTGGTLTLGGATFSLYGNANTTSTINFATVASGGAGNVLIIPAYEGGNNLGPITNLGYGDIIRSGSNTVLTLVANGSPANTYSLENTHGGQYTTVLTSSVTLAPGTIPADFTNANGDFSYGGAAPCFLAGTRLATPDGDIAVEDITAGTMLLTLSGQAKPVRWLGRSVVSSRFADPLRSLPVRIKAGALGDNLPSRDLRLSPDHAMFLGGVLIQAGALVNGTSIVREDDLPEVFTYYHVELATHELLLAEGAATESFIDNVDRMNFQNWEEHEALGELAPIVEMDHPRAKAQRQVPMAVRRLLAERAAPYAPVAVAA